MIHYINGVPAKNIRLTKAKRRAVDHYRHTQRVKAIKSFILDLSIMLLVVAALAAAFLIGTN